MSTEDPSRKTTTAEAATPTASAPTAPAAPAAGAQPARPAAGATATSAAPPVASAPAPVQTGAAARTAAPAQPKAVPVPTPVPVTPRKSRPIRRFFMLAFSHILFAAVAGILAYHYHKEILAYAADTVCADNALGFYRSGGPGSTAAASPPSPSKGAGTGPAQPSAQVTAPSAPDTAPTRPRASAAEPGGVPPAPPREVVAVAPSAPKQPPVEGATASSAPPPAAKPASERAPAPVIARQTPAPEAAASSGPAEGAPTAPRSVAPPPAATTTKAATATPAELPSAPMLAAPAPPAPVGATPVGAAAFPKDGKATAAAVEPSARPGASDASTLSRRWQAAREAFNAGDQKAVGLYRALVAEFPDIPDLAGELGNVHYRLGDRQAAAEQYYEAGLRQLRGNEPGLAACTAQMLASLDPALSRKLAAMATQPCPVTPQAGQAQAPLQQK